MRALIVALALLFAAAPGPAPTPAWAGSAPAAVAAAPAPATLDRSQLVLTFWDEFGRAPNLYDARMNPGGTWKPTFQHGPQSAADPQGYDSRTLKGNGERQVYTGRIDGVPSPVRVESGYLVITAARTPEVLKKRLWGYEYTSGLITTEPSFSQTYGYFEIRAQLPKGKGLWPAFWLLPTDKTWPPEIDVLEAHGDKPTSHFASVHYADKGKNWSSTTTAMRADLTARMVTYGLLWTEAELVWYQNDIEVRRAKNPGIKKPMYLLVNLAVGGNWPGLPDTKTKLPADMRVDWVRAYALKAPDAR